MARAGGRGYGGGVVHAKLLEILKQASNISSVITALSAFLSSQICCYLNQTKK